MNSPLLLPNLGAEEGGDWRRLLREPRVGTAARLWRWLFPAGATVAGEEQPEAPIAWQRWPAALETNREAPAFDWLGESSGCVPWLADAAARADPAGAGLAMAGPAAEVVAHVHDKAFAWQAAESVGLVPRSLRGTVRILEPRELEHPEAALDTLRSALDDWPDWTCGRFTLKPRLGTSGRGRIDGRAETLDAASLTAAFPRLARCGGAVLEPWLDRIGDLSAQVRVSEEQGVVLMGSLELLTGPSRACHKMKPCERRPRSSPSRPAARASMDPPDSMPSSTAKHPAASRSCDRASSGMRDSPWGPSYSASSADFCPDCGANSTSARASGEHSASASMHLPRAGRASAERPGRDRC